MSALELVRDLPERREEHGVSACAVSERRFRVVDQRGQLIAPCLVAAGCQFPEPCREVCWLNVRER